MASIPLKTINGNVFAIDAGHTPMLGVAMVDLPDLQNETENMAGFGILGTYEAPLIGHFQDADVTFHFHTITQDGYRMGRQTVRAIEVRTSIQFYNTATQQFVPTPARYSFSTFPKAMNFGKIEPNKSQDFTVRLSIIAMIVYLNDARVMQIDKFAGINEMDGVDVLAPVRRQLGL